MAPLIPGAGITKVQAGTITGAILYLKAGVPSDSDFTNPVDGIMVLNTLFGTTYVRVGGSWFPLGVPSVKVNLEFLAQTAVKTVFTYTSTGDGPFRVSGYLNPSGYTSGTITLQVAFTDENGLPQTLTITTANSIAFKSESLFIRAKTQTTITVSTTGTFSATYDVGAVLERLF